MNENPYQVPSADLAHPAEPGASQLHEPRAVNAGRGLSWLTEGWQLFMKAPVMFAVMGIIFIVLFTLVSLVPLLGWLATALFWPHAIAGFYLAFRRAHEGQPVDVGNLFEPFKDMGNLVALGGMYLAASVVLMVVMMIFMVGGMGASGLFGAFSGDPVDASNMDMGAMGVTMLLGILIAMALGIPIAMAFLFAPVLVHQHALKPMDAIKMSFNACLRNIVPFLVWSLVWFGALILLVIVNFIPLLGQLVLLAFMLVAMPLAISNLYVAYREIFID